MCILGCCILGDVYGIEDLLVREGESVRLRCRSRDDMIPTITDSTVFYWIKITKDNVDNVAIDDKVLDKHYK